MRIILVGAAGTLGSAVDKALNSRHEIVRVGRKSGDFQADIADPASIDQLFSKAGKFDALVSTAGNVHFGPLAEFDQEKFQVGLRSKLTHYRKSSLREPRPCAPPGQVAGAPEVLRPSRKNHREFAQFSMKNASMAV